MYVDKAVNLLCPERLNTVRKQENILSKTILLRLFLKERDLKLLYRDIFVNPRSYTRSIKIEWKPVFM